MFSVHSDLSTCSDNQSIMYSIFFSFLRELDAVKKEETKLKKTEQELQKISSGIGKGYVRQLQYSSRFTE